jgi:hypothetical protein
MFVGADGSWDGQVVKSKTFIHSVHILEPGRLLHSWKRKDLEPAPAAPTEEGNHTQLLL